MSNTANSATALTPLQAGLFRSIAIGASKKPRRSSGRTGSRTWPSSSKPCHDILDVSGYFRRLTVGTRLTRPPLRRTANVANGCRQTKDDVRLEEADFFPYKLLF